MPEVKYEPLSPSQGFNYSKDVQEPFGHVLELVIGADATGNGGTTIAADIAIGHPGLASGSTEKVVGVLTSIVWAPGSAPGDPIHMKFQVSTANKIFINDLVHKTLESIDCKVSFQVWDYDPLKKKYFKAFYDDPEQKSKPLKAQIFKEGNKDLMLKVTGTKGEVQAPENWEVELKVVSQPVFNYIVYASGIKEGAQLYQVCKQWGVKIGTS